MQVDGHKCVHWPVREGLQEMDVDVTKTPDHQCIRCGMWSRPAPQARSASARAGARAKGRKKIHRRTAAEN